MGTHPIFESDFDCLTVRMGENENEVEKEPDQEKVEEVDKNPETDTKETKKKKKKKKEEEGTQWWEWALIIAVLSYKIYTPLPENISDRYPRSVGLFMNKAVYKVGHFIRIVSPGTEISYLEGAWGAISHINNRAIEGIIEKEIDFQDFKISVFSPENPTTNGGIYYIHGGVSQSLDLSKRYLREMAKSTGSVVFAPDYRRPPNAKFPTGFDDCLTGITYIVKHADEFGIDPKNLILSGDSFGAQIALSMSFTSGSLFKAVSVNNPPTQNILLSLPSHQKYKYFMLSDTLAAWYWSGVINGENGYKYREYLKNSNYLTAKKLHKPQFKLVEDPFSYFPESEMTNPEGKPWRAPEGDYMAQEIPEWMPANVKTMVDFRLSPFFANKEQMEKAPKSYIFNSELDIFSNDGKMMAHRMKEAGVSVEHKIIPMAMHNEHFLSSQFWGFNTMIPSADKAVQDYFSHLKSIL